MKRSLLLSLCGTVLVAACSTPRPLLGRMEKSGETFNGSVSASGYRSGTGELVIASSRATCKGDFVYVTRRRADGVLKCDDGRSGNFHIAVFESSGNGYGDLEGQRFTFTFGAAT